MKVFLKFLSFCWEKYYLPVNIIRLEEEERKKNPFITFFFQFTVKSDESIFYTSDLSNDSYSYVDWTKQYERILIYVMMMNFLQGLVKKKGELILSEQCDDVITHLYYIWYTRNIEANDDVNTYV